MMFSLLLVGALVLLREGMNLTEAEAVRLEQSLERSPNDHDARVRLLAYWTTRPETADAAAVKAARARHITWMVQRWPQDELFGSGSRMARIHLKGRWADPEAFAEIKKIWMARSKVDRIASSFAAEWLELGDPQEAASLYESLGDRKSVV